MVNMTLSLPEQLHKTIKKHSEVKWSEVARKAMWEHARKLEIMDIIASKSRLTPEDAEKIGAKIKKGIAKKHGLIR